MKEYKMDQFFREKLASRKEIPSDNAWEKLSMELSKAKKKKKMVYWYVAASVVFFLGLGYLLVLNNPTENDSPHVAKSEEMNLPNENEPSETLAHFREERLENKAEAESESNDNGVEKKSDTTPEPEKKIEAKQAPEKKDIEKRNENQDPEKAITPAEVINIGEAVAEDVSDIGAEEPQTIIPDEKVVDQLAVITNEEYPEIVITYKKSTTEEKPEKTLKKIVNLARDFTEGGYGIGQLREAKNELLAFERKNNKDN